MNEGTLETLYVVRWYKANGISVLGSDLGHGLPAFIFQNRDNRDRIYRFETEEAAKAMMEKEFSDVPLAMPNFRIEPEYSLEGIDYDKYPRVKKYESLNFEAAWAEDGDYNSMRGDFIIEKITQTAVQFDVSPRDIKVNIDYYDYHPADLGLSFYRVETDDEYRERVKKQIAYEKKKIEDRQKRKTRKQTAEEKERTEYERLKKKYEGK